MAAETKIDIDITPDMLAAGLKVLHESGAIEHPMDADLSPRCRHLQSNGARLA